MANLAGAIAASAAVFFGGWEWALMCIIALLALKSRTPSELAGLLGTSMIWLALFHWTGDRRLFFPYTMQFVSQMACHAGRRSLGQMVWIAAGMVGLFVVIRAAQQASARVLTVEIIVAAGLLGLVIAGHGAQDRGNRARAFFGAFGSALAYAGLGF